MSIKTIPTFGESSENNSGSGSNDTRKGETVQTLELTSGQIEAYTEYEAAVDMGRYVAKLRKHDESDDLAKLMEWIVDQKEEAGKACEELPGNLPMFRAAFPVEDRTELGFYVLPSAEAAKVGIDYDSEDHLLFPVIDGEEWMPSLSLGRATYVEGGEAESAEETESGSEPEFGIDGLTVAEIRETVTNVEDVETLQAMLNGEEASEKPRKTAITAIEARLRAVSEADGESEFEDEQEAVSEAETTDEIEKAKVEALKALTETLTKTTEIIETL
ncbi:hypothetical protein DV706_14065 [Natronorubrum bangense]|uniref:Uncharacterized protein n=1 Tax=Natronorubrum bangense TaxID=61858 RepID=A0A4D6HMW6_9EURY|nr:hypothetical protein [Natronorubrum bangense]QCC55494.1 hypothetical protein DV706_14065 [Natronorubrum bangense]